MAVMQEGRRCGSDAGGEEGVAVMQEGRRVWQ